MEHLINTRVREIQISGIRKFYNLVSSKYPNALSLTIGQPDFPTPEHIKEAGKMAIGLNKTVYTPNAGLLDLRKAISNYMSIKYNLEYSPEDEIIVTNGASEAIDSSLRTILEEGCEVILPGPVYPGYEPIIHLCGAKPVYVDTRENGFKMTAKDIASKITDKTRCIIIPSPSNPTGTALDMDELLDISMLIKDKEIFILSDEIYSELVYNRNHISIASLPGMRDKTIVINGLSKSHSMTGWRIGFVLAPKYLISNIIKVHQYNSTCASSISQYAAIEALINGIDDATSMRSEYIKRRDYVYEKLVSAGFDVIKPDGAFYVFPSIKKFNMTSLEFAANLLEKENVAVVPGDAFSEYGEGYIRISYACSMDTLIEAMDRIKRYVEAIICFA